MALIAFVGRLGADPEFNGEPGKDGKCKFTVAEDKKTEESDANWWSCTVWGKSAEFCAQYLHKGRLVYITGDLQQRKNGEKTYYNVKVHDVKPLDRPRDDKPAPPAAEYDPFES